MTIYDKIESALQGTACNSAEKLIHHLRQAAYFYRECAKTAPELGGQFIRQSTECETLANQISEG